MVRPPLSLFFSRLNTPVPCLGRLVLQALHQLCCSSLNPLQQLSISLAVRGPVCLKMLIFIRGSHILPCKFLFLIPVTSYDKSMLLIKTSNTCSILLCFNCHVVENEEHSSCSRDYAKLKFKMSSKHGVHWRSAKREENHFP